MFLSIHCTICKKRAAYIVRSCVFPELEVCWQCLRDFQLFITTVYEEPILDHMLKTFGFPCLVICDGFFARDFTTSTSLPIRTPDAHNYPRYDETQNQLSFDFTLAPMEVEPGLPSPTTSDNRGGARRETRQSLASLAGEGPEVIARSRSLEDARVYHPDYKSPLDRMGRKATRSLEFEEGEE